MAGALTVAGIGPIVMPLVMSELMDSYGARGTVMLLSGLVLNTVCTALLLHPIKWHRKLVCEYSGIVRASQEYVPLLKKKWKHIEHFFNVVFKKVH